jgi:branched-subunit amino acid ABC-type transport system permease component
LILNQLLQLVFNGVVSGATLAIAAAGASLVWGVLRIGNFAHGDYMALGAFTAYVLNGILGFDLAISTAAAMLVVAAFSVVVHKFALVPMRSKGLTSVFIVTVGVSFVVRNLLFIVFGAGAQIYRIDQSLVYVVGPLRVSPGQVITIVVTAIAIAALGWLLAFTTIGRSMRAVSENSDLAAVTGVNTDRLASITWIISGGLAGLAGVCLGLIQGTFDPNMGAYVLFLLFTSVVLGGIGSAYGALGGGLVLGLAMEVSTWSGFAGGLDPRYKFVLAFVVLILMLLARPQGIFGKARLL